MTQTTTKGQATKVRTTKRRTTNKKSLIFKILVLLIGVMAIFEIFVANTQVFTTEIQLMSYHLSTIDYNDSEFTSVPEETMRTIQSERNKLYDSDNPIVWMAANAPTVIKILLFLLSVAIYGAMILLIFTVFWAGTEKFQKKRMKQNRH